MSARWTAFVAITQWTVVFLYVITWNWLALVWVVPALMWTFLAITRLRDDYGIR